MNTLKKIGSVALGATMLAATLCGALAQDLNTLPGPFVTKDGKFDAFIVVGEKASSEDVVGAVDIGASMQFEMKKESSVSCGSEDVIISDGVKIKGTGSEILNYGESIGQVRSTPLDEGDLPIILSEGRYIESEGNTDNDETYVQELLLGNESGYAYHEQPEDLTHDDYLELNNNKLLYTYTLEFDDPVEFDPAAASEDVEGTQIEIQGQIYTITDIKLTGSQIDDMTLMAGETVLWLMQDTIIEKTVSGVKHEIKVVDVTDSEDSCGISVDGDVAWIDTRSDKTVNGINIGVLDAKAVHAQLQDVDICELNIGATEIRIKDASTDDPLSISGDIIVDGEEVEDAEVGIVGDDGLWNSIIIQFTPDEDTYLAKDQTLTDPVLQNFKFMMGGVLTPREDIKIEAQGSKKAEITFTNNDGKELTMPIFVNQAETQFGFGSDDDERLIFEGETLDCGVDIEDCEGTQLYAITTGKTAHIIEITNLDSDEGTVNLKDLTYGRTFDNKPYSGTISLGSLGNIQLTFGTDTITATDVDANNANEAETMYGAIVYVADSGSMINSDTPTEIFRLVEQDIDDADINSQTITVNGNYDTVEDEIEIKLVTGTTIFNPSGGADESEDNSDTRYYTTEHGTLIKVDEEDDRYINIMYPQEEVEINAFVAPTSAQISANGGLIKSLELQKLNVGAARLDTEISDVNKDNLILVGGPCANKATATIMEKPYATTGCDSGFEEGEAIIKLYENEGKVAMVVAGQSALDTRRATRVVSNFRSYNLSGKELKITGTSLTDIKINTPS